MDNTTRRARLEATGLGTLPIGSAVGDTEVTITYEIPGPVTGTTSRGSTLDHEPVAAGRLLTDASSWSRYVAQLSVADLAAGDHIYTVAATLGGRVVSGSTIFTIPAA